MKILILDDEEILCVSVSDDLRDAGYETETSSRAKDALDRLRAEAFDVVVADIRMPDMDGIAFLEAVRKERPDLVVVMMTAYATVETAVRAMKLGAYDYLTKPFDTDELILRLDCLRNHRRVLEENQRLRAALAERHGFHNLVGKSPAMQKVYAILDAVCPCDCTVLISGETGTGSDVPLNISPDALSLLLDYLWPGNVRELKTLVERLLIIWRGAPVQVEDFPTEIRLPLPLGDLSTPPGATFDQVIASVERRLIRDALERANGNKTKAAELLGMTPSTFRYKLASLIPQDPEQ